MSDDIVSRLREQPVVQGSYGEALRNEAIAEIERLREAILKYGAHKDCGWNRGHDCTCGITELRDECRGLRRGADGQLHAING